METYIGKIYDDTILHLYNTGPKTNYDTSVNILDNKISNDFMYIQQGKIYKLYIQIEGSTEEKNVKLFHMDKLYYNEMINSAEIDTYYNVLNFKIYSDDIYIGNGIDFIEPQLLGNISGDITLTSCQVPANSLSIRVFRSDNKRFVCEYPLINNHYDIPNLYVGIKYDVILCDSSKTIEHQVSSARLPLKYEQYKKYIPFEIIGFKIIDIDNIIILKWDINMSITNGRIGIFEIYMDNNEIDIENLQNYKKLTTMSTNIKMNESFTKYLIIHRYKDTFNFYRIDNIHFGRPYDLTVEFKND